MTPLRLFLLLLCSIYFFAIFIPLNSLKVGIGVADDIATISILKERIATKLSTKEQILQVQHSPRERYSTRQLLVAKKGFVGSFSALFLCLFSSDSCDSQELSSQALDAEFYLFNPFQAKLTISDGQSSERLDINVPDRVIEHWRDTTKVSTYQIPASVLLRLSLAIAFSALMCAIAIVAVFGMNISMGDSSSTLGLRADRLHQGFLFVLGAILCAYWHKAVTGQVPGFGDEMNYLFQGKIFLSGRLFVEEPAFPEFFKVPWMDLFSGDGKIWGFHPPGNSLLLAMGLIFNAPYIIPPIICGLNLVVLWRLTGELDFTYRSKLLAILIVTTSHYFISLSASYMAHAPALLANQLLFLFSLKYIRYRQSSHLVLASLSWGVSFLIRPLSAILICLVPLFWIIGTSPLRIWPRLMMASVPGLAIASFIFFYSYQITGEINLPYLLKGPESGIDLWDRLSKGPDYWYSNLYRNINEFQHRVHSFGFLLNTIAFCLAGVFLFRVFDLKRAIFLLSFLLYVILHSALHWYGWKWEPRMLFEASFLFFLLSADGLSKAWPSVWKGRISVGYQSLVFVTICLWLIAVDLPRRLVTEYNNYLSAPRGVVKAISNANIQEAIIFFERELPFASYFPSNSVTFDGDLIYAKSIGQNSDYRLITRFPRKRIFWSEDGTTIVELQNFYRNGLASVKASMSSWGLLEDEIWIVVPWKNYVEPELLGLPLKSSLSPDEFIDKAILGQPRLVPGKIILLGEAQHLGSIVEELYIGSRDDDLSQDGMLSAYSIDGKRDFDLSTFNGFKMRCYPSVDWKGEPESVMLSTNISQEQCPGEWRSAVWETTMLVPHSQVIVFGTESDDGSGVFIDGEAVLDNGLQEGGVRSFKEVSRMFNSGSYQLVVKYFNGPGMGTLRASITDAKGRSLLDHRRSSKDDVSFRPPIQ